MKRRWCRTYSIIGRFVTPVLFGHIVISDPAFNTECPKLEHNVIVWPMAHSRESSSLTLQRAMEAGRVPEVSIVGITNEPLFERPDAMVVHGQPNVTRPVTSPWPGS